MCTVNSTFAKVARNKSIIFNYTLLPNYQSFLFAKQYQCFFPRVITGTRTMKHEYYFKHFFSEWIKGSSSSFITED